MVQWHKTNLLSIVGSPLLPRRLRTQVSPALAACAVRRKSGHVLAATERTTTAVKSLLVGLFIMLVSAGAIFAASPGAGTGMGNTRQVVTIQATPSSRTIRQNDSVSYPVSLSATNGFSDTITPTVSGLPVNTTAAFTPASVQLASGETATVLLTVMTSDTPPEAKAEITIATAAGPSQAAGIVVQPDVQSATRRTFGFSGDLSTPLSPGATVPLNLSISNSNNDTLSLNGLSVSINGISRTQAAIAAALPCTPEDYKISEYSGPNPLTIPAGHSTLQSLDITAAQWPKISMLDTSLNQDGCKGATLNLAYSEAPEETDKPSMRR